MSESHTGQGGLRASRQVVRRSAQALADAIDRVLWAFQNMPEADALRRCLVGCKSELDRALESSGYVLEVRDGFSTKVRKRLSIAASVASAAARIAAACGSARRAESAGQRDTDTTRRFVEQRPDYERLCEEVARTLRKKIDEAQIEVSSIPHRAKALASFLKKLDRKDYVDPFNEIMDFAGVRVVCLYPSDLEKIEDIIVREFEVVERSDKQDELGVSEFGYSAVHFIVRLGRSSEAGHDDLKHLVCEVQVRTVLQDAWAIIQNHLVYKQESQIPDRLHRKLNSLAGLCEVADDQFERLREMAETPGEAAVGADIGGAGRILGQGEEVAAPAAARIAAPGGIKTDYAVLAAPRHAELLAAARPQLDIRGEPTGWMSVDFDNGRILVHPTEQRVVQFKAIDSRSGADLLRAKAQAQAYAMDHPAAAPAAIR
jgi:ppGpp synthetase/RelA/SpoT-type nucleotidyltranferase